MLMSAFQHYSTIYAFYYTIYIIYDLIHLLLFHLKTFRLVFPNLWLYSFLKFKQKQVCSLNLPERNFVISSFRVPKVFFSFIMQFLMLIVSLTFWFHLNIIQTFSFLYGFCKFRTVVFSSSFKNPHITMVEITTFLLFLKNSKSLSIQVNSSF